MEQSHHHSFAKREHGPKKNSSEHEPPLRTEVDLSEGAAPDLAAEAELVPDPGFHYSRNSPKEKKERKKLPRKRALFRSGNLASELRSVRVRRDSGI
jgi:hypothetical protein